VRSTSFTHDAIIIGQGLAGTALSVTMQDRGKRVLVFDAPRTGRASEVAPGVVNPVSLRRTVLTWRASEMLAIAGAFYRDLGLRYEHSFWNPTHLVVIFPTAQEAGIWQLRTTEPETSRFVRMDTSSDQVLDALPQPFGRGIIERCAWVHVQALLHLHRTHLRTQGALLEEQVEDAHIERVADGVRIGEHSAPIVIRCGGPFDDLEGLVPVKGEGLTVRIPGLFIPKAVHRGVFVLPIGDDVYRVGATFGWDDVWSGPTDEARHHLLDRLERMVEREVEVLDHWCGVRPASKDRRPILGRTGEHEFVFNGLGSRGVVLAPWCAQHLCDHLFDGAELDEAVRVERFRV
jgi:glycine/D-amino acid oxidase-like deaminating enzyme